VPAIASSLLERVWSSSTRYCLSARGSTPDHPLGCHRRRIPDRVVFDHIVDALVHGSGYERIATVRCSDSTTTTTTTTRRRLKIWSAAGVAERVHIAALAAADRIIGLHLGDIAADGCITKAPGGGDKAAPCPVDSGQVG
jgi:hypothetical protein